MQKTIIRLSTSALLMLTFAVGCQPEVTPNSASNTPDEPASAEKKSFDSPVVTSENGLLTVAKGRIDLCSEPEGLVASEVSWDASSVGTEGTQVWLKEAEKEPVLWSESGAKDSSATGKWLRDGTEVILINGENKQELARIKVEAIPCKLGNGQP